MRILFTIALTGLGCVPQCYGMNVRLWRTIESEPANKRFSNFQQLKHIFQGSKKKAPDNWFTIIDFEDLRSNFKKIKQSRYTLPDWDELTSPITLTRKGNDKEHIEIYFSKATFLIDESKTNYIKVDSISSTCAKNKVTFDANIRGSEFFAMLFKDNKFNPMCSKELISAGIFAGFSKPITSQYRYFMAEQLTELQTKFDFLSPSDEVVARWPPSKKLEDRSERQPLSTNMGMINNNGGIKYNVFSDGQENKQKYNFQNNRLMDMLNDAEGKVGQH